MKSCTSPLMTKLSLAISLYQCGTRQTHHLFSSFSKLLSYFQEPQYDTKQNYRTPHPTPPETAPLPQQAGKLYHFKWLNSSFKWLNICQAPETWDCAIIWCSPLILAILPLLLFTFSSSNDEENLPNLRCSHSIKSQLCKGKEKIKSSSALRMHI